MKLVIIEPLGVNDEKLLSMAKDMLPADLEIVYYNTRVTDTETLIERGHDADIIAVSNLPMNADVINGCKNLKMLSVASPAWTISPWTHVRPTAFWSATARATPPPLWPIWYLA